MVPGFAKRVKAILSGNGWAFSRSGKGDHEIWSKPGHRPIVVDNGMLSRHTANAILKQAGVKTRI